VTSPAGRAITTDEINSLGAYERARYALAN